MNKQVLTRREAVGAAAVALVSACLPSCKRRRPELTSLSPGTSPPPGAFTWKTIASGNEGPGPRSRHVFAYDKGAKAAVLFGGVVWHKGWNLQADAWELRDGHWSRVESENSPPARHRGAMVYDGNRGHCLLFGGQGMSGGRFPLLGDTWTYTNRRWQQWGADSGTGPEPRCGHALAFDDQAGVAVLFGGITRGDRSLDDTWLFDGARWRPAPGPAPSARRYAAFAYDPSIGGCVLNGGSEDDHGRRSFGDTWLFRDHVWTRLASGFDTEAHDDHGLAYHQAAKRIMMFGGLASADGVRVLGDTCWLPVEAQPLPPRYQCSPLAWDTGLDGVVYHGGEARHEGHQFDTTWVLQRAPAST